MAGSNLSFTNSSQIWPQVLKSILHKMSGLNNPSRNRSICFKDGAPADNTANDDPGAKGVVIWDYTNKNAYICNAYTNPTTFTVAQLNG